MGDLCLAGLGGYLSCDGVMEHVDATSSSRQERSIGSSQKA
ncbi:MAG: hypothetical protein OJF51_000379 [Nitrospira sp.]|nr:MAG: hypothetical protein OJF51_000379 [Nitrospira sp.]